MPVRLLGKFCAHVVSSISHQQGTFPLPDQTLNAPKSKTQNLTFGSILLPYKRFQSLLKVVIMVRTPRSWTPSHNKSTKSASDLSVHRTPSYRKTSYKPTSYNYFSLASDPQTYEKNILIIVARVSPPMRQHQLQTFNLLLQLLLTVKIPHLLYTQSLYFLLERCLLFAILAFLGVYLVF